MASNWTILVHDVRIAFRTVEVRKFERNEKIPKKIQLLIQTKCMMKRENNRVKSDMQEILYRSFAIRQFHQTPICVFWCLALMRLKRINDTDVCFSIPDALRVYVCPDCKPFENVQMRSGVSVSRRQEVRFDDLNGQFFRS